MICANLIDLPFSPSLSSLIGTTGSQAMLDTLNRTWSGGSGVIFGQDDDPFKHKYQHFMTAITDVVKEGVRLIQNTADYIFGRDEHRIINDTDTLALGVPVCMHIPILTSPRVRELFMNDQIYGFGLEKFQIPEEDQWGRLIANGSAELNPTFGEAPTELVWEWHQGDPDYTFETMDCIDTTRKFFDTFLAEQLGPGADRFDPTDYPSSRIKMLSK